MSYNNEGIRPFVIDLETVAIDGAGDYLETPTAPSNYKDAEKIAAYISEARQKALDKAALDLDLTRIVALGYASHIDESVIVLPAVNETEEADLLAAFWKMVGDAPLLGFNIVQYDLPVLLRRSLYLDVPTPPVTLSKYKHPSVIDLMQILSFDGLLPYRSLSFYCRRFGLDVPADDSTGADIARLVAAGDWDGVTAHCRADVIKTRELARRIGVLPAATEV